MKRQVDEKEMIDKVRAAIKDRAAAHDFRDSFQRARAGDRFELPTIADQHDLGAGVFRRRQYGRHIAGSDHAGLVDQDHG